MEVYYELSKSPPTHDFVNWLVRAEQYRKVNGASELRVGIVRGSRKQSPRDFAYSEERRERRIWELLVPLTRLLPSVRDVFVCDRGEQLFAYTNFKSPQLPVLSSKDISRSMVAIALPENPVTISIRQSDFEVTRNSNLQEWKKVAHWLKDKGYSPVIIPDAEAIMIGKNTGMEEFFHYQAASMAPDLRLATYELSVTNLITTGGPMVMGLFSDISLMCFKMIVEGIQCASESHMKNSSMSPEDNWGPKKRIYWLEDTAENIVPVLDKELPIMMNFYNPHVKDVFQRQG